MSRAVALSLIPSADAAAAAGAGSPWRVGHLLCDASPLELAANPAHKLTVALQETSHQMGRKKRETHFSLAFPSADAPHSLPPISCIRLRSRLSKACRRGQFRPLTCGRYQRSHILCADALLPSHALPIERQARVRREEEATSASWLAKEELIRSAHCATP